MAALKEFDWLKNFMLHVELNLDSHRLIQTNHLKSSEEIACLFMRIC